MKNAILALLCALVGCGAPIDSAGFEAPTSAGLAGAPSAGAGATSLAGSAGAPSMSGSSGSAEEATAGSGGSGGEATIAGAPNVGGGGSGSESEAGSPSLGEAGGEPSTGEGGSGGEPAACMTHELQAERGLCYEITGRLSPYSCELPEAPRCFWLANEGLKPVFTLYGEYDTSYKQRVLSMLGGKCPTECPRAGQ